MYTPPAFREDRPDILYGLIRAARLPMLVSNGAGGVPDVTHLPLVLEEREGVLLGHFARANPHWRATLRWSAARVHANLADVGLVAGPGRVLWARAGLI